MRTPRQLLAPLSALTLLLAGCTGGDDAEPTGEATTESTGESTGDSTDEPAAEPSDEPTDDTAESAPIDDDLASAMWTFHDAEIEVNDFWQGDDTSGALRGWQVFPGNPTVAVAENADGHVALVSDDGIAFRPVHRGCCGVTLADRAGDRVVTVAVGPTTATAFVSPDAGASWTTTDVVLPGGSDDVPILPTAVVATADGYVAVGRDTNGNTAPAVFSSPDLTTWTPYGLAGLDDGVDAIRLVSGGDVLWVAATVGAEVVPFRSVDAGVAWQALEPLTVEAFDVAAVSDRLLLWAAPTTDDPGEGAPWLLVGDDGWARAPRSADRWGGGLTGPLASATDPDTGRIVAVVERGDGPEIALTTSIDGVAWDDVDAPAWDPPSAGSADVVPTVAPTGADGWLVWQPSDDGTVTIHHWTGPAPVPTTG